MELYGTEVSPDLISKVTDAVLDEVRDWQNRPLDPVYPVVFFDALRVKIRDEGTVKNKAIYVALGLNPSGEKDVLGLWIEQTEGAKFWLKVMNDLKARGLNDILIAVVDGLKGFPEAITSVFPQTLVQTCIVHLIRNSLSFVTWKDRKAILPSIKAIYRAENADQALVRHAKSCGPNLLTSKRSRAQHANPNRSRPCSNSCSHPSRHNPRQVHNPSRTHIPTRGPTKRWQDRYPCQGLRRRGRAHPNPSHRRASLRPSRPRASRHPSRRRANPLLRTRG